MKAVVMAGGEGTRLRPMTIGCPKPMVKLFDRPVIEHIVELLKRNGLYDICFTLGYLPETIREYFGDGSGLGVRIESLIEKEPLGTAGGVRACSEFIGDDDVLVISGDAVCDFDLKKCIGFHYAKKADATLILYEHPTPLEYGLVVTEEDGRIKSFVEKPAWDKVVTNTVNTGIYILSNSVVNEIPENKSYDFGKDVFPKLLREKRAMYGVSAEGYWCDIGSPDAYLECCRDILSQRADMFTGVTEKAPGIWTAEGIPRGVKLIPPVYIGKKCVIGKGAKIGPYTVLGEDTLVEENAAVSESVINGAVVKRNASVSGAVAEDGAVIGEGAEVMPGCVLGSGSRAEDGSFISENVRIWPQRRSGKGRKVTENIVDGSGDELIFFDPKGVLSFEYPAPLSPEKMMAAGSAFSDGRTGIAFTGGEAARILASAFACGVCGAGGEAAETDCRFETEMMFSCAEFMFSAAVFIRQEGKSIRVSFFGKDGLPLPRPLQRKAEAAMNGEHRYTNYVSVGSAARITGCGDAYISAALETAGELAPFYAGVKGAGAENRALKKALLACGCEIAQEGTGAPAFEIQKGGRGLVAWDEDGKRHGSERMLAAAAYAEISSGRRTLTVPMRAPAVLDAVSEKAGCALKREKDGRYPRSMIDGIFSALTICRYMKKSGRTLTEIMAEIPGFSTSERRVDISCGRARAMRELSAAAAEISSDISDGLFLDTRKGKVRITPCGDMGALRIRAEAETEELAEELCGDFEDIVRRLR